MVGSEADEDLQPSLSNDLGSAYVCDCCGGGVLAMGPVSMHFDIEQLDELAALVQAVVRVDEGDTQ